jgi:hypothetical protein
LRTHKLQINIHVSSSVSSTFDGGAH